MGTQEANGDAGMGGKKYVSVSQVYGEICRRYEVKRSADEGLPRAGTKRVNRVFTFVSDFPKARRPVDVPDEQLDDWIEKAVERLVELVIASEKKPGADD